MDEDNNLKLDGIMEQGYGIIPKKVMRDKNISVEAKSIYSYLCSYSGNGSTVFPSVSLICSDLGIGKNRFYKHRKELTDYGYVEITNRKDGTKYISNIYKLPLNPCIQFEDMRNEDIQFEDMRNEDTNNNNFTNNNFNKNNNKTPKDLKNRFEELWKEYPNKKGKYDAFRHYKTAINNGVSDEAILDGIRRYNQEIKLKQTDKQYIANGSTWFNQKRWEDEYLTNDKTDKKENQKEKSSDLTNFEDINWDEIYG